MKLFNRPIFISKATLLTMRGQKKLFEEMRQAHEDDITKATKLPQGFIIKLEGGLTMTREEWLETAAVELTELTAQIDALAEYV